MASMVSTIIARTEQASTALLVDTDASSQESLCKLLAECRIRTIVVTNSVAAMEVLRTEPVEILICEDLGGLYGVEVLEVCAALFPSIRRVYLARKASAELHCEAVLRGHVHATVSESMHPVDLRNVIASLTRPPSAPLSTR
jgi:response regulator RpfG family c-di-GMP phosphodiesterase